MAEAKGKRTSPKNYRCVYLKSEEVAIWDRLDKLARRYKLSTSSLVVTCVMACVETLEKEVPKSREFVLNGNTIVV
jgi:hypothetical protein